MAMTRKRYTVLTYNFEGYEPVREVQEKDPEAEYVLVTDDKRLRSKTWTVMPAHVNDGLSRWEKCYDVRFHPFDYANTGIVVRLDASIEVRRSLKELVDRFEGQTVAGMAVGYDRCLMIHPHRTTMQAEYEAWCCERGYPQEQAADMLHVMRRLGYDLQTHGLFQGCFEIVRKNRVNQLINDITYDLLRYVASDGKMQRISQTWFSMVVNHLFADKLNVMAVSQDIITDGRLMQWCRHGTQEAIKIEPSIAPIMFGHKVDVWKVNP